MLFLTNIEGKTQKVTDWKSYTGTVMSMSFQINKSQKIVMKGFSEYLRMREELGGVFHNIRGTGAIILLGRAGNKVIKVTIDLLHNKVTQEEKDYSRAYNNKPLNSIYWKKGVLCNPKVFIQEV